MTMKNTFALTTLIVALASGCGDGKHNVSGLVTLDGKPVKNGSVSLEAADGSAGVFSGGIHDGKYELRARSGSKKVRITAYRSTGDQSNPTSAWENYIPARYND